MRAFVRDVFPAIVAWSALVGAIAFVAGLLPAAAMVTACVAFVLVSVWRDGP